MTPLVRYNVRQVAEIIGKSPSWLYQQGAAGNIPRSKLGHHVWWTEAQIAEILRSAEQPAKHVKQPEKPQAEQKRQTQSPPKHQTKRKRTAAPTNAKTPVADFSVSRLYRKEGAA